MKATIQIKIANLKATNVFASKEETRYYLNGVLFEMKGSELNFVATDGHRLIKFSQKEGKDFDFAEGTREETLKFIIPAQLIEKVKIGKTLCWAHLTVEGTETLDRPPELTLVYDGASYSMRAIDGTFHDYERVIPDKETHTQRVEKERDDMTKSELVNQPSTFSCGFNPALLGDFAKVNKIIGRGGAGVKIEMLDDKAPAFVTLGDGSPYLAVLMPMRT